MAKNSYWISDTEGVYALVEGADSRDEWTRVYGWSLAAEPGPVDQVHVVNENPAILPGRLPYAAVALLAGFGWKVGAPPVPYDTTRDPALVDQARLTPAGTPAAVKSAVSGANNSGEVSRA